MPRQLAKVKRFPHSVLSLPKNWHRRAQEHQISPVLLVNFISSRKEG
jgi:hypothetical protein